MDANGPSLSLGGLFVGLVILLLVVWFLRRLS